MRLLVTADLHYNHPRSRASADELIDRMNAAGGDVLLLVGDTAVADGDSLEQCLGRFRFDGPKLIVAGNHELWTKGTESYSLFTESLPQRIRSVGWHWLENDPFIIGDVAFVGSVGWYDYRFAPTDLGIPKRFFENKISPGAAERFSEFSNLFDDTADISESAREIVARWNDGKFVKLGRSDEEFLGECLLKLRRGLEECKAVRSIVAAVHHVPFASLLPPRRGGQWDFVRAYLGSPALGALLGKFLNVRHLFCGHSHFPAEAQIGGIHAVNVGSGYREKRFLSVDI